MRRLLLTALSVCGMLSAAQAQNVTFKCIGGTNFEEKEKGEGCEKAFDGKLETKWSMDAGDKFAVVEASQPVYLTGYTLVNADNSVNQDIKEWEIFGTNDEKTATTNTTNPGGWTRFERVREHNIGSNNYSAHHISLNPLSTAYKYIMFKRVAGSGDASQLSEISLAYSTTPDVRQGIGYTYIGGTMGYGNGQDADKVFDNHWGTKLCANPTAYYYVTFTTPQLVNVNKVNMATANDDKERDPKRWTLYGSDDEGNTWEKIYSHDGDMPSERKTAKTFEFTECSVAYSLFKLEIYYTRDGNGQQKMQISELSLNDVAASNHTVVDATPGFSDKEGASSLFDGKTDTKWCCPNPVSKNWYVEFTTGKGLAPTGYYFTTANDYDDRDPKAWTLYGSTDEGKNWIELDSRVDQDQTFPKTRREYVEYVMTQPSTSYSRYKLVVTERRGNGNGLVQFGEFGLLTETNGNLANNNHIIVYEGSGGNAKESVQKMFDGVAETKWCAGRTSTVFGVGHTATLYGYGIHMADEFGNYDRRPKNWTLQGSNDYSTWTEIDKVVDTKLPQECLALAYYPLDAPAEYKYYKFTIDATQGASIFQIGEFVPVFDGGTLNKLELRDGTEPTFCGNATVSEFVYDRTVTAGNVATFILPVEIPVNNVNGTVWQLEEYTGSALKFTKVENGTLAANKPYLVQPSSEKLLSGNTLEDVDLKAAPETSKLIKETTDGKAYQMGTYKQLASAGAVTDGTVYGYTGGKFVQAESGTLNPFRTLFVVKEGNGAAAREISLVLGDQETGIVSITKDGEIEDREVDVYDLGGHKVAQSVAGSTCLMNLPAGVYVVNGKKYVIK